MSEFMTNAEVVDYLGLPQSIITDLQTQQGNQFQSTANQFLSALVNKICYQKVDKFGWVNPFKKFDSFPVNYGDTIENIFVELPKGYTYDKNATDPFAIKVNDVKTLYATINYEMQYCATIYDALLRRACLNEYGFSNLVTSILGSLTDGKNIDEYFAEISLLNNINLYPDNGTNGFKELDVSGLATSQEKAHDITAKIVDLVSSFAIPSTKHNKLGLMQVSNRDDILLIIRRDLYNMINLDYLTGVFNLSKVDLISRIMVVESFKVKDSEGTEHGEDLGFIVLDTRCFDNHIALEDGGLIYNPKNKSTNHFMNLWKIMSFKYFFNAEAYKVKLTA